MRFFPVVNLGQYVQEFEGLPLDGQTLSRLCDAVNAWYGASSTSEGARTMRDAVADIKSILGPMGLTDRRAAEAQMRQVCRNPTPLLDQIPFAVPPTAEQTTTAYTPFSTRETPPPPPPETYKPVASVDRFIRDEYEEPAESLGPEGITYPPPPVMGPPGKPIPPPMVSTGPAACWYTPGQGYSWGSQPPGGQATEVQKQSDCENLVRLDQEIRGLTAAPTTTPAQPQVTDHATGEEQTAVPTQGTAPCPVGSFIDPITRKCRGSVATGAGGGGLFNQAMNLGPSGGVAASGISLMGQRYRVVNL